MSSTVDYFSQVSFNNFLQSLETEDVLGCVLRLHLQVEEFILIYIKSKLTSDMAEVIKQPKKMYFAPKVELATALGLPKEVGLAALSLNRMRNEMGHQLGRELTPSKVRDFSQRVDAMRKKLCPQQPSVFISSIQLYQIGGEKITYGKKSDEWDLKIAGALFYSWLLIYFVSEQQDQIGSVTTVFAEGVHHDLSFR